MEPLDWQRQGYDTAPDIEARRKQQERERSQRMIQRRHASKAIPLVLDGAGIPTDAINLMPATEEQLAATVANILTAPDRGVDMVNLPPHYARFVIEPIRFICENRLDFFQGNIVKYILRHDAKNGLEDIDKVIRYATMYKRFLAKDPDWWRAGKPEDLKGLPLGAEQELANGA